MSCVSLPLRPDNYIVAQTKIKNEHRGLLLCLPLRLQQVYLQEAAVVMPEKKTLPLVFAWMQRPFFHCMQGDQNSSTYSLQYKHRKIYWQGLQCAGEFRIRAEAEKDPSRATKKKKHTECPFKEIIHLIDSDF